MKLSTLLSSTLLASMLATAALPAAAEYLREGFPTPTFAESLD